MMLRRNRCEIVFKVRTYLLNHFSFRSYLDSKNLARYLKNVLKGDEYYENHYQPTIRTTVSQAESVRSIAEETVINNHIGLAYCAGLQSPIVRFPIFAYQPSNKTR